MILQHRSIGWGNIPRLDGEDRRNYTDSPCGNPELYINLQMMFPEQCIHAGVVEWQDGEKAVHSGTRINPSSMDRSS